MRIKIFLKPQILRCLQRVVPDCSGMLESFPGSRFLKLISVRTSISYSREKQNIEIEIFINIRCLRAEGVTIRFYSRVLRGSLLETLRLVMTHIIINYIILD